MTLGGAADHDRRPKARRHQCCVDGVFIKNREGWGAERDGTASLIDLVRKKATMGFCGFPCPGYSGGAFQHGMEPYFNIPHTQVIIAQRGHGAYQGNRTLPASAQILHSGNSAEVWFRVPIERGVATSMLSRPGDRFDSALFCSNAKSI